MAPRLEGGCRATLTPARPLATSVGTTPTTDVLALRRAALWALLAAKMLASWGVGWDIQWHVRIGRDSFWIPPHVMTYAGVSLVVLLSFGVLVWETVGLRGAGDAGRRPRTIRRLGLTGTRGFHVAAWGISVTVLAAPIDALWHRIFGLDVTLWSPPHLLGFLGGLINTVGCLLIAREAYPEASRARLAALVVSGAWLYGTLDRILEPASLVAYQHGGIRFHTYAMLAALVLPLTLVGTARLTGRRWAPIAVLLVLSASGLAGREIARVGFAWVRPVSVIGEEIAKDPTSPIALAHEIARKNRGAPGSPRGVWTIVGLLPAVVMAAVDARRWSVAASLAWAVALFAFSAAGLARSPAFQVMVPGPVETGVALAVTAGAAALSGLMARRVCDLLSDGVRSRRRGVDWPPRGGP